MGSCFGKQYEMVPPSTSSKVLQYIAQLPQEFEQTTGISNWDEVEDDAALREQVTNELREHSKQGKVLKAYKKARSADTFFLLKLGGDVANMKRLAKGNLPMSISGSQNYDNASEWAQMRLTKGMSADKMMQKFVEAAREFYVEQLDFHVDKGDVIKVVAESVANDPDTWLGQLKGKEFPFPSDLGQANSSDAKFYEVEVKCSMPPPPDADGSASALLGALDDSRNKGLPKPESFHF